MIRPIFGLMSAEDQFRQRVGIVVVLMVAALFALRKRGAHGIRLAGLSVICGPIAGLLLALLVCAMGEESSRDWGHLLGRFVLVGTFAGLLGGVVFGLTPMVAKLSGHHPSPDGRGLDSED